MLLHNAQAYTIAIEDNEIMDGDIPRSIDTCRVNCIINMTLSHV